MAWRYPGARRRVEFTPSRGGFFGVGCWELSLSSCPSVGDKQGQEKRMSRMISRERVYVRVPTRTISVAANRANNRRRPLFSSDGSSLNYVVTVTVIFRHHGVAETSNVCRRWSLDWFELPRKQPIYS